MKLDQIQCDLCTVVFASEEDMIKHRRSEHTNTDIVDSSDADSDENPSVYICNYCTYTCMMDTGMRIHYDKYHEDEFVEKNNDVKKFQCKSCAYNSNTLSNLTIHNRIHTCEKPYKCDTCKYSCITPSILKVHKRTHTGKKPYKCDTCKYSCTQSSRLKEHKTIHTSEKPYKCNTCKFSCKTSSQLKYHTRTHTGEKPYKCDTCKYSCTTSSNLNKHKLIHR